MATRRRMFVIFFSEKEDEEPVVMAVAGSLKKAKALSVEAYNELNDAYPMQTQAPTVWQDEPLTTKKANSKQIHALLLQHWQACKSLSSQQIKQQVLSYY